MTPRLSAERYQRLGATIRAHVDQERNLSSAVDELRSIELLQPIVIPLFVCESFAKNAGTSVDQIVRFYARDLPLSGDLQSFGSA